MIGAIDIADAQTTSSRTSSSDEPRPVCSPRRRRLFPFSFFFFPAQQVAAVFIPFPFLCIFLKKKMKVMVLMRAAGHRPWRPSIFCSLISSFSFFVRTKECAVVVQGTIDVLQTHCGTGTATATGTATGNGAADRKRPPSPRSDSADVEGFLVTIHRRRSARYVADQTSC